METLEGRTAFITGAGSGLGFAIAQALAEQGANLAITDVDGSALDGARQRLEARGAHVHAQRLDVTDRAQWSQTVAAAENMLGPLHVLVNNAGVYRGGRLGAITFQDWDWVIGVNTGGVINGVQTVLPRLLAHGDEAHVVNVASMAGLVGVAGLGAYNTSKFAVVGLSEALRGDLVESSVEVSVLCPGMVRTRILESERTRPAAFAVTESGAEQAAQAQSARMSEAMASGIDAEIVARAVIDGIVQKRFWLLTHPEMREALDSRHAELTDALDRGRD